MKIVVPKETWAGEDRVVVLPDSARALVNSGHEVYVQSRAAYGIRIDDEAYRGSGAKIITDPAELYGMADMTVKLKAPTPEEFSLMKPSTLFCMLHSEQNPERVYYAGKQGLVCVGMENIRDDKGKRLVDQTKETGEAGVYYALRHLRKLPREVKAVVLGYGNVSTGAIQAASTLGMNIKIIRKSEFRYIPEYLKDADILMNGLTWPKSKRDGKEYLVTRGQIKQSNPDLIVLDISVDFPSPIETMHPTDYMNPFYMEEGRVHISIYGYPGLFPVSSSRIYSDQVMPLAKEIADNGGTKGIGKGSRLGKFIQKAVLNPGRMNWQKFAPQTERGSRIE